MTFQICALGALLLLLMLTTIPAGASESLKIHGIFKSSLVLQREKPIPIWGWAPAGKNPEESPDE